MIKLLGDGSMLAFESADAAVQAAVTIQRSTSDQAFDVRVGIHTGQVLSTQGDLFGLTVNKAARIAAAAGPGEVVISSTTRDLIGASHDLEFGKPRMVALKGLKGTHQIVPVSEQTTPA